MALFGRDFAFAVADSECSGIDAWAGVRLGHSSFLCWLGNELLIGWHFFGVRQTASLIGYVKGVPGFANAVLSTMDGGHTKVSSWVERGRDPTSSVNDTRPETVPE